MHVALSLHLAYTLAHTYSIHILLQQYVELRAKCRAHGVFCSMGMYISTATICQESRVKSQKSQETRDKKQETAWKTNLLKSFFEPIQSTWEVPFLEFAATHTYILDIVCILGSSS